MTPVAILRSLFKCTLLCATAIKIWQGVASAQQPFYPPPSLPARDPNAQARWFELNGKRSFLLGANFPWYNGYRGLDLSRYKGSRNILTLADSEGYGEVRPGSLIRTNTTGFDREGINAQFEEMHRIGIRALRWFWGNDGRAFFVLHENGACSLDEEGQKNLNEILKLAKKNGIYIAPVLLDFRFICGDTHLRYENGTLGTGYKGFITDAQRRKSLIENCIVQVVKRVNASGNGDVILYWEIMNEAANAVEGLDPATGIVLKKHVADQVSPLEMRRFLKEAYEAIKSADPKHAVMPSGLARPDELPFLVGQVPADLFGAHYSDSDKDFGMVMSVSEIEKRFLKPHGLALNRPLIMTEGPSVADHLQYYIDSAFDGGWAGYFPWSYYGLIGLNPLVRYDSGLPRGNAEKRERDFDIYRRFNLAHAKELDLGK